MARHSGVPPPPRQWSGNGQVFHPKLPQPPEVFSEVRKAGGITGVVAHGF